MLMNFKIKCVGSLLFIHLLGDGSVAVSPTQYPQSHCTSGPLSAANGREAIRHSWKLHVLDYDCT